MGGSGEKCPACMPRATNARHPAPPDRPHPSRPSRAPGLGMRLSGYRDAGPVDTPHRSRRWLLPGGILQQIAKTAHFTRARIAHHSITKFVLAPTLDAEAVLALIECSPHAGTLAVLEDEHRKFVLAQLKQQLRARFVLQIHKLPAQQ